MRFLKENFDSIIKLLVNQIGIAIFAFFLYTAAPEINTDPSTALLIKVLISLFSVIFYFALIYNVTWEIGAKDKIRIDAGRVVNNPLKGLWLGLFANATNFIVIGLSLILFCIYLLGGPGAFYSIFLVLNAIFRIFVSMYLGMIQGIFASFADNTDLYYLLQTIGFLVFSLLSALFIFVSYIMGLKDYRIFGKKNNTKSSDD